MNIKPLVLSFIMLISAVNAFNQEIWPTKLGDLSIHPIRHASMVWQWNGKTIYIDPVGDASDYKDFKTPDIVLISHSHGDHLSAKTLEGIQAENAIFVVPQEVADKLDVKFKSQIIILANGEEKEISKLKVKAVPAYNYPITEKPFHVKGVGNGYVVSLGGKRVYLSGDTGNIPEMADLKKIDLAFLCMNLPYTMDIDDAAKATLSFNPKIVYPYHFRSQGGFSDLAKFKQLVAQGNKKIEVRILDWYPEKK